MKSSIKYRQARSGEITIKDILKLPYYIVRGIKYHAAGLIYSPKPKVLAFLVTRRCNSRCIMCSIWKTANAKKELSVDEIREIAGNPLFNSLEIVILGGGEPTQRQDLAEVVQAILDANPRIKEMGLTTNGLKPSTVTRRVREILELPNCSRLKNFTVQVSLDGYGVTHEKIRRVPQAFDRVQETLGMLKSLQLTVPFSIRLNCVVQPSNVSDLPRLSEFAWEQGFPINFVPIYISGFLVDNIDLEDRLTLGDEQLKKIRAFWERPSQHKRNLANLAFWQDYFHIIRGEKRRVPCAMVHHAVTMDADGTLFICGKDESLVYGNVRDGSASRIWRSAKASEMRRLARQTICPSCSASCLVGFACSHEFFYYAKFLLKAALKRNSI